MSVTGTSQAWFVERHASYAGLEEALAVAHTEPLNTLLGQLDAQDGELLSGDRGLIATYRERLSYLPAPPNLPKYRFFSIGSVILNGIDLEAKLRNVIARVTDHPVHRIP